MSAEPKIACRYCQGSNIQRNGIDYTTLSEPQTYYCKDCQKYFRREYIQRPTNRESIIIDLLLAEEEAEREVEKKEERNTEEKNCDSGFFPKTYSIRYIAKENEASSKTVIKIKKEIAAERLINPDKYKLERLPGHQWGLKINE